MESVSQEARHLLNAIRELYHNPDQQVVKQAERWIGDFQQSQAAWTIALGLLQDANSPTEAKHLCAMALRNKCMQDLEELPRESVPGLRDSLVSLLLQGEGSKLSAPVRTQLCLAFSGIAAHVPAAEWQTQGPVFWLESHLTANHEALLCMVEILAVLAEEAGSYKPSVRPARRREFKRELEESSPKAFQLLTLALQTKSGVTLDVEAIRRILRAFCSWLALGGHDRLKSAVQVGLHEHPLVQLALKCLESQEAEVFDMAVDVICCLIHSTLGSDNKILDDSTALVHLIMSTAFRLRPQFNKYVTDMKSGNEDIQMEDVVRSTARLLVEIAEAYLPFIASAQPDAMGMLDMIVDVSNHPQNEVSSMSYDFWYRLSVVLTRGLDPESKQKALAQVSDEHKALFFEPFGRLVICLRDHVCFPEDSETWSKSDLDDFKRERYAIADALKDASKILGVEKMLPILGQPLNDLQSACAAGQPFKWRVAEGVYYSLRSLGRVAPLNSPAIYSYLVALPSLPREPTLLNTSCLVVAAYADWMEGAMSSGFVQDKTLLSTMLSFLSSAFDSDASAAAALAFRHICNSCRKFMVEYIDELKLLYSEVIRSSLLHLTNGKQEGSSSKMLQSDVLLVVQGVVLVALATPVERRHQAIHFVSEPILSGLQNSLSDLSSESQLVVVLAFLDQLTAVFQTMSDKEIATQILESSALLLDRALEVAGPDVKCAERVIAAIRSGVKAAGTLTGQTVLQQLLTRIPLRFARHSHPCLLYLASELVKTFGHQPPALVWLKPLVSGLVNEASTKLSSQEDYDNHPDIVDDMFLLAGRILSYCPQIALTNDGSGTLQQLFECAMRGTFIQHREACLSILSFLFRMLDTKGTAFKKSGVEGLQIVQSLLASRGLYLTRRLIAGIAGMLPKAYMEDVEECLHGLITLGQQHALGWVFESLSVIPTSSLTDLEKQTFMTACQRCAQESKGLLAAVDELSELCRRNPKAREGAIQALIGG